jgi:hypothetical protein
MEKIKERDLGFCCHHLLPLSSASIVIRGVMLPWIFG